MSLSGQFITERITRVLFGAGSLARLSAEVDALGAERVLLVTGRSIATRTPLLEQVAATLGPRLAGVFTDVQQHVPESCVRAAAQQAQALRADCVVSLGGGSPVDAAKGVALLLAEGEDLPALRIQFDYPGPVRVPPLPHPKLPHIAVTTTLSAGEFSDVVGITDDQSRVKHLYAHRSLCPRAVILDPALTLHTPLPLFLATGVKALDHNVERLYSRQALPISDALALESARLLHTFLPRVLDEPGDLDARCHVQVAAYMSVFSSANVRVCIGHALGHQLGALADVPHGVAGAILLPHTIAFNASAAAPQLARLAETLGAERGLAPDQAARAASAAVAELVERLGLPRRLRDVGVPRDSLHEIASAAIHDMMAATNPRPVTDADELVRELLEPAW